MKIPISYIFATLLALSSWLTFVVAYGKAKSKSSSTSTAIHPDRDKLLQDAVSWLTLRNNGDLAPPDKMTHYVDILRKMYRSSKYYRTFVIAFQFGVLPKLTLKEGQSCDPAYTLMYKNPLNNSVTWHKQKDFTFQNYYKRNLSPSPFPAAYCDYRKGLYCIPNSKKCECPEGSKMSPIGSNSQEQRCLLEEDQPCTVVDPSSGFSNSVLETNLHKVVFNLEKPLSCMLGTKCGFGRSVPKCLKDRTKRSSLKSGRELEYGEQCVLGNLADGYQCTGEGTYRGGVCFNFWGFLPNRPTPSSWTSRLLGFCAQEYAPYVTYGQTFGSGNPNTGGRTFFDTFVASFVNSRTVPLDPQSLAVYVRRLNKIRTHYDDYKKRVDVGKSCSVKDTTQLLSIWNFYAGLEKNPTGGEDYVADDTTLNTRIEELETLIGTSSEPKICRVYWETAYQPALTCVPTGNTDDGTCQISKNNDSLPHALIITKLFDDEEKAQIAVLKEATEFDAIILGNHPDAQCSPGSNFLQNRSGIPRSGGRSSKTNHDHGEVLEGGFCHDKYICSEDFSDTHGIYKEYSEEDEEICGLIPSYKPLYSCFDALNLSPRLGGCEEQSIQAEINVLFGDLPYLGRGESCSREKEKAIRHYAISEKVSYMALESMKSLTSQQRNGICDQLRLLECGVGNTCECIQNTAVRMSNDKQYTSDYCYLKSGPCKTDVTKIMEFDSFDKKPLRDHYGDYKSIGSDCSNGNICVIDDSNSGVCTSTNTEGGSGSGGGGSGGGDGGGDGSGKPIGKPTLYGHAAPTGDTCFETMIIGLLALLYFF